MRTSTIAALIVAAVISGVAAQAPRSTQNERPGQITTNPQPNQQAATNFSRPANQNASKENSTQRDSVTPDTKDYSVRISAPVQVKSGKDGWDKALVVFTGLIVIVGGFQIYFLWSTVQATKDNAIAARDNAEVAKEGAKSLIASERAWIHGEFTGRKVLSDITRYSLTITNQGKTPAQVIGYDVWHGLLTEGTPFSKEGLTNHFSESKEIFIGGGQTEILRDDFDLSDLFTLTSGETAASQGFETGAFCVTIKYWDVVTEGAQRKEHRTSFVYHCNFSLNTIYRISQYNEYT